MRILQQAMGSVDVRRLLGGLKSLVEREAAASASILAQMLAHLAADDDEAQVLSSCPYCMSAITAQRRVVYHWLTFGAARQVVLLDHFAPTLDLQTLDKATGKQQQVCAQTDDPSNTALVLLYSLI